MEELEILKDNWMDKIIQINEETSLYFSNKITLKELIKLRKKSDKEERRLRELYRQKAKELGII